jgi:hypothetical protein
MKEIVRDKNKKTMSFIEMIDIRPVIQKIWGEGVPELFTAAPVTSVMVEPSPEQVRAPVNMRRMSSGTIILLSQDNTLSVLAGDGVLLKSLKVPNPDLAYQYWQVIDYVMDDEENIYLLEIIEDDRNKTLNLIRKINNGNVDWQVKEKVDQELYNYQSLNTKYQDLIVAGEHLYVCAGEDETFYVFEVNKNSGKLKLFQKISGSYERVFMSDTDHLYYVKEEELEEEKDKRYWVQYDINTNKENFLSGNDEMYDLLGLPVSVDDNGRGYGVFGFEMGCINNDNSVAWKVNLENIVYAPATGDIYLGNFISDDSTPVVQVNIIKSGAGIKKQINLKIPAALSEKYSIKNWRLIYVNEEGKFLVSGFNPNYYDPQDNVYKYKKILITYDALGKEIEDINHAPGQLYNKEYKLQGANSWQVDGAGNLYLPVLGPDMFYVFKITG